MNQRPAEAFAETVLLRSDNGAELSFQGRMFSESGYYDEETGLMTKLRLFVREDGSHVYSVVSGGGMEKSRRHYVVSRDGDLCAMSDGRNTVAVPTDMLFAAVFGLCGIDPARAEELRPSIEQSLRLAAGV